MTDRALQDAIRAELHVGKDFDAENEAQRRICFLADYLTTTGLRGYVLGISGGVDSTTAGRLCQLACEQVRAQGQDATFIAMRLPYRQQRDEDDAQAALRFIDPDRLITVNIAQSTDAMWQQMIATGAVDPDDDRAQFVKGNVKARERMIAQFTVAGARSMAVIGTDHAAEAVVGFYTKFGDGAADLTPLAGLSKRRVRQLAAYLGCPAHLVTKVPTADLESDKPLHPDEIALGVSYEAIDDYLEGGEISPDDERTIVRWYRSSAHKRALPITPDDWENRTR